MSLDGPSILSLLEESVEAVDRGVLLPVNGAFPLIMIGVEAIDELAFYSIEHIVLQCAGLLMFLGDKIEYTCHPGWVCRFLGESH